MNFQPGQLVKCIRAINPRHQRLVGSIGTVEKVIKGIDAFIFGIEYVVTFPCYPTGQCAHCNAYHDPLYFLMLGKELGPIDDPDAGQVIEVGETQLLEWSL